jgi:hypothetical protein
MGCLGVGEVKGHNSRRPRVRVTAWCCTPPAADGQAACASGRGARVPATCRSSSCSCCTAIRGHHQGHSMCLTRAQG